MTNLIITDKFRVTVEHFDDGWGWQAWETRTADGWRPLFTPTMANDLRRFRTAELACEFFLVLAEIVRDSGIE